MTDRSPADIILTLELGDRHHVYQFFPPPCGHDVCARELLVPRPDWYMAISQQTFAMHRKPGSDTSPPGGFTLLESMTVITLILLLATISVPMFHTVIVHGREAVLREDLFTLRTQIDRFTHDNARGPARLEELVEKEYMESSDE